MLKRKLHTLISQGTGRQLLWLMVMCVVLYAVLLALASLMFGDLAWQEVLAPFLDPGCFGGTGKHDWFRLIVTLAGAFTFTALLVSVFSNIIDNISDKWHKGYIRYKHHDHILILGSMYRLVPMLKEMEGMQCRDIVIMTTVDVEQLRKAIDLSGVPKSVAAKIVLYHGSRDSKPDLMSVSPEKAGLIYIIGEDDEPDHDSATIASIGILTCICKEAAKDIDCYAVLNDGTTTEVMSRTTSAGNGGRLRTDYVCDSEYDAEQLLVGTDFLPVIGTDSPRSLNMVVIGTSSIARAVAFTTAHIAHYPNFDGGRVRTRISMVAPGIEAYMRKMTASMEGLFRLSRWTLTNSHGAVETHIPASSDGDYLDIEWEFIDASAESPFFRELIAKRAETMDVRIAVCHESESASIATALHLPQPVRDSSAKVAVYCSYRAEVLDSAIATGLYGDMQVFGPAAGIGKDHLMLHRAGRGKQVNYIYDQAYGNPPSKNADEAWYKISEAHKLSSIYCANAMPLRMLCFDKSDRRMWYDAEHRRWMTSCLIMGYRPLSLTESASVRKDKKLFKELKAKYIHADIAPFDQLSAEEQEKDRLLIENLGRVME